MKLNDPTLIAKWQYFFEEKCKSEIETTALNYPDEKSLTVDYWTIDKFDPKLADFLIDQPLKLIFNAEEALKKIDVAIEDKLPLHFRVNNIPDIQKISIRNIRSCHLGKLIAVDGLVKRISDVRPKLKAAKFLCHKCGAIINVDQDDDFTKEPSECFENQDGCGRVSSFKLLDSLSKFVDSQKVEIQENPEGLRGGAQPKKITILLADDLVGNIEPGDRIIVNGILSLIQKSRSMIKFTDFDIILDAVSIENQQMTFEEVNISEEDEKIILQMSKEPNIFETIKESIAPTIFGMHVEKEALVLLLFGGVSKRMPDGSSIRGDIHSLFVGDPGTAKSQILSFISKVAPRSVYASGKSSSAAGLTATVVKDDLNKGQWSLEAGTLVLADMGIACIDELDKMDEKDRNSIHQAMEQQEISVAKAGINATLKSRCSVLAAANPKLGRFDDYLPIHEQIKIDPPLLSRFDLIFSIKDKPSIENDRKLSNHVLNAHKAGEISENIKNSKEPIYSLEEKEKLLSLVKPKIETDLLRKYVAYAKRNVFPVLTNEAKNIIQASFTDLRNKSKETVPFTPRQLEAFVRLAEASARVRLSEIVTEDDAKRSIKITYEFLRRMGVDSETGNFDYDVIATGISHSQHDRMVSIFNIIKQLSSESTDQTAEKNDILIEASNHGLDEEKTRQTLIKLKKIGDIIELKGGKFRLT